MQSEGERCRTSSRNTGLDGDTLIRWQSGEGGLISDDDDDDEDGGGGDGGGDDDDAGVDHGDDDGDALIRWQSGEEGTDI